VVVRTAELDGFDPVVGVEVGPVADLIAAAECYQAAGRAALARQHPTADDWFQAQIALPDRRSAEHTVATMLAPTLRNAEAIGTVASWWYVRKTPYWRFRLRADRPHREPLHCFVATTLDDLVSRRLITTWSTGVRHRRGASG
jgi:hypothetical protein